MFEQDIGKVSLAEGSMWDVVIRRPGQRLATNQAVIAIFQPGEESDSNCNNCSGNGKEGC